MKRIKACLLSIAALVILVGCASPQDVTSDGAATDNASAVAEASSEDTGTAATDAVDASGKTVHTLPLNTTENTEAVEVIAEPVTFKEREGLHVTVDPEHKSMEEGGCDNCTFLLVDSEPFRNGTIEIDIAGAPKENSPAWARGFVGIVFRVNEDKSKYEGFYLRPVNALEQGERRNNTAQYFSYPDHPWNVLRRDSPGQYENYADVKPGEWSRLRVEVEGANASFFIDDQLVLAVDDMFHGADLSGGIGLFTEPETDAYFSNLVVTSSN